jgi:hypothetical protein
MACQGSSSSSSSKYSVQHCDIKCSNWASFLTEALRMASSNHNAAISANRPSLFDLPGLCRFDDDPLQAAVDHAQALRSRTLLTLPPLDTLSPPGIPQQQQQQHLQHVQAWVRNKFRRFFAPFLVLLLCACLIAWRAGQWVRSPFFPVTGVALPLAKCFVTISEICFGLLFLPVSRNLVTWLRWVQQRGFCVLIMGSIAISAVRMHPEGINTTSS